MKSHHYAAIAVIVVLIGVGYVLTVWMHATLGGEHQEADTRSAVESASQETTTSESNSETTSSTEYTTDSGEEQASTERREETDSGEVASQEAESTTSETTQTTAGTQADTETTETVPVSASASSGLSLVIEQIDETNEASIAIELHAIGQSIDLSGWRLSDAIGASGHTDHLYYFGNQVLSADQPLTILSACGRDQGLRLYWCLSSPLAILDSEQQELFFHNERGDLIFTCTPIDPAQVRVRYECV